MQTAIACAMLLIACGRIRFDPIGDSGGAALRCDPSASFGQAVLVDGLNDSASVAAARLSADEREVFFELYTPPRNKLYTATRATSNDRFGASQPVPFNDAAADNSDPMLGVDGVSLTFTSDRTGGVGVEIWLVTRPSPAGMFGAPTVIANVDGSGNQYQPYLMGAGVALWYTSTPAGSEDIYQSMATMTGFGVGTPVDALNMVVSNETFAVSNDDGTVVYFGSDRVGGEFHMYTARRASSEVPFDPPAAVVELNSAAKDEPSWLSPDMCRLYFTSWRLGGANIFVAERQP